MYIDFECKGCCHSCGPDISLTTDRGRVENAVFVLGLLSTTTEEHGEDILVRGNRGGVSLVVASLGDSKESLEWAIDTIARLGGCDIMYVNRFQEELGKISLVVHELDNFLG